LEIKTSLETLWLHWNFMEFRGFGLPGTGFARGRFLWAADCFLVRKRKFSNRKIKNMMTAHGKHTM